ncbi:MAG: TonB-dependent receptor [Opitutus sp.]|nr:TonB-dependent receptor [Opitutus sp.]
MSAGRVFLISLPTVGSSDTNQTSKRCPTTSILPPQTACGTERLPARDDRHPPPPFLGASAGNCGPQNPSRLLAHCTSPIADTTPARVVYGSSLDAPRSAGAPSLIPSSPPIDLGRSAVLPFPLLVTNFSKVDRQKISSNGNYFPLASTRRCTPSYSFTENFVARAAYARTIGRPDLNFIIPSRTITDPGSAEATRTITTTNAALAPWTADNYDLSFESYSVKGATVAVSLFRKNITSFFVRNLANEPRPLITFSPNAPAYTRPRTYTYYGALWTMGAKGTF